MAVRAVGVHAGRGGSKAVGRREEPMKLADRWLEELTIVSVTDKPTLQPSWFR